jgi:hypothetical protein
MEEKKKEYGGCLGILLPLWIVGQIVSMIYNFMLFGFYTDNPTIPILLIGINVVALIGIILLLQFKKMGFFIFVFAYIFSIIIGFACPDSIDKSETIKIIIGMCLFLILMGIKNKETKKNGYQTLEIFSNQQKTDDIEISTESVKISNEVKTDEEQILFEADSDNNSINEKNVQETDILENRIETNESSNIAFESGISDNQDTTTSKRSKISKKKSFISAAVIMFILIIGCVCVITHDWRSDEEKFKDAKRCIEEQQYKKAIEELEGIQESYIPAKSLLGELYVYNDSTQNINRGEKLLKEASELDDTTACVNLWNRYAEKGEWDKMKELSERLIGLGNWKGYLGLALLYSADEFGGTKNAHKNYKKAEYYALKNANTSSRLCLILGNIYSEGGDDVERDYSKSFYWWQKGSKLEGDESEDCSYNLGWLYYNGYGVRRDYKKAYESYKLTIKKDETMSDPYYQLSVMFRNGQYVKANKDSVRFYLQKAAKYGDTDAAIELENEF